MLEVAAGRSVRPCRPARGECSHRCAGTKQSRMRLREKESAHQSISWLRETQAHQALGSPNTRLKIYAGRRRWQGETFLTGKARGDIVWNEVISAASSVAPCRLQNALVGKRFAMNPDAVDQSKAKHDHDQERAAVADQRQGQTGDRHELNGHADILVNVKENLRGETHGDQ